MSSYIELNDFLKINNVGSTGGQVKLVIRSGVVRVNGEVETRNRRKLVVGDTVEFDQRVFKIGAEVVREHT